MTHQTEHIDEQTLSRFVLNDDVLDEKERSEIVRHLSVCKGCEDLYKEIEEFYTNAESEYRNNPSLGERKKTAIIKKEHSLDMWIEPISAIIPRINVSVPARIWYFARKRPIVSSASFFAAVAVLVLSINTFTKIFTDTNPSYFRFESKNLVIYNKNEEVLWKKPIDSSLYSPEEVNTYSTKSVWFVDIDGDGINEVVTIFSFLNEQSPPRNAITVYNNKGEIVWRKKLGSSVRYGEHQYPLDFRTGKMVVYDDGKIKRLLVLINHTHSPSAIVSLDEKGNIVGEYWNYGHFSDIVLADVDGDGKEELVTTLLDDEKNQPVIAAIDPKGIVGKTQSPFNLLAEIEVSDALKYYSNIVQNDPFIPTRYTFSKIASVEINKIKVEYGPSPGWFYTFTFGKNLLLDDILATDEAIEKYGVSGVKNEIIKLKQAVKHWENGKPPV